MSRIVRPFQRSFSTLLTMALILIGAGATWAGWDEAVTAYTRGDYATALKEFYVGDRGFLDRHRFAFGALIAHLVVGLHSRASV